MDALFEVANGFGTLTVTFDQPLQPGPTAAFNWAVRDEPPRFFRNVLPGVIAGAAVTLPVVVGGPAEGLPATCDYFRNTDDVKNLAGVPAEQFLNFLTRVEV